MLIRRNSLIPKARLLGIYIKLLIDNNPNKVFTHQDYKDYLKKYFDFEASLEDIACYCEPNYYEEKLDLEQQMKNLQIRYE